MRLPPGLTFLDHTADVGIAVAAPSLESLFHRAALGMLALLRGAEEEVEEVEEAPSAEGAVEFPALVSSGVELEASGVAGLLVEWLRELLFLHGTEHRDYVESEFQQLEATVLRARVRTAPAAPAVREIKGVTYHELVVEPTGDGWAAQVIFDV